MAAMVLVLAAPVAADASLADTTAKVAHTVADVSGSGAIGARHAAVEAHGEGRGGARQLSIAQVIQRAREQGAQRAAHKAAVSGKQASEGSALGADQQSVQQALSSPTALDVQVLRPAVVVPDLHAANINTPELAAQQPSYGTGYSAVFDRTSAKGNPLVWTMAVVYGGMTVLVVLLYVVWSDGAQRSRAEKPKPDLGQPVGYSTFVL